MVEWLAGKRIKGTSSERTGLNGGTTSGNLTPTTLSGSHVQNTEGGWKDYTVYSFGGTYTITSARFQGTTTYGSAPKNGQCRWVLSDGTVVATYSVPINQSSYAFDTSTQSVSNVSATSVKLQIFQEGENGSPTISVTSSTNTLAYSTTLPPNLQNGTIFEETDTNKAYIWSSSSQTWTQL
jgi:uncharacterized membrane protein